MSNTRNARPLGIGPFSRSAVDILIPFHSQYEKIYDLVKSIVISVKSNPYQITLIDDCSENEEFGKDIDKEFAKSAPPGTRPQVRCIRSEKQMGFGGALKVGFNSTTLPWVMFMHSDCVVEDANFMINMGRSLLEWKKEGLPVKMVSAMSDNPGEFKDLCLDGKDKVLKDTTMPMFCCMCNRALFDYVGGFVKPYPFAWYEDEEFSYRMKKYGLLQGVCAKAKVKHAGGSTIKYLWAMRPETKAQMEANRERCISDIQKLTEKNPS